MILSHLCLISTLGQDQSCMMKIFQNNTFQKREKLREAELLEECLPEGFPVENERMRNASRRKALYQWCPICSYIKLHTIHQAIIFVCFFCSRVSARSSGAVHCVNTPRDPSFLSKQAKVACLNFILRLVQANILYS